MKKLLVVLVVLILAAFCSAQTVVIGSGPAPMTVLGQGYTWSIYNNTWPVSTMSTPALITTVNNQVLCFTHVQLTTQQISKVTVNVTTLAAASTGDFGWYDMAGNKIVSTAGAATTATGVQRFNLTKTVTLQANTPYYFCQVDSDATVGATVWNTAATVPLSFLNQNASPKRSATAANAAAAGVLPATLGVLTAQSSVSPVVALFE